MLSTGDDFAPRRDGWFEHRAKWGEVVVGTVIASPAHRSERWEIIEVAHGLQVEHGMTLWMRAREQSTGAEFTSPPRSKTNPVIILTQDPADTHAGEPSAPADSDAIMLLVEKLGATHLATRDDATGEITCPDLNGGGYVLSHLAEHLHFAHGLTVDVDISLEDAITLHGRGHNPKYHDVGKGGFPHRHTPEDLSIYTKAR